MRISAAKAHDGPSRGQESPTGQERRAHRHQYALPERNARLGYDDHVYRYGEAERTCHGCSPPVPWRQVQPPMDCERADDVLNDEGESGCESGAVCPQ